MTKSILTDKVSEQMKELTRKQIALIINTIFDSMKEALNRGDKIEIRGFGIFKVKHRKAGIARNPKTGQKLNVPERRSIHFKIGRELHNALNKIKQ